jgi:hypothetical protein
MMKEFLQVYLISLVAGIPCFLLLPLFHLIFKNSPRIRKLVDLESETRISDKIH